MTAWQLPNISTQLGLDYVWGLYEVSRVGFNSEIQGYNVYPMLHFHRKFSSSVIARKCCIVAVTCQEVTVSHHMVLSQMVTYLFVIGALES